MCKIWQLLEYLYKNKVPNLHFILAKFTQFLSESTANHSLTLN